jgi:hypothetical protein
MKFFSGKKEKFLVIGVLPRNNTVADVNDYIRKIF